MVLLHYLVKHRNMELAFFNKLLSLLLLPDFNQQLLNFFKRTDLQLILVLLYKPDFLISCNQWGSAVGCWGIAQEKECESFVLQQSGCVARTMGC